MCIKKDEDFEKLSKLDQLIIKRQIVVHQFLHNVIGKYYFEGKISVIVSFECVNDYTQIFQKELDTIKNQIKKIYDAKL